MDLAIEVCLWAHPNRDSAGAEDRLRLGVMHASR